MKSRRDKSVPYQLPLRWWASAWRYTAVVGVALLFSVSPAWTSTTWMVVDIGVGLVCLVALRFRRRWPVSVGVLTSAATMVSLTSVGSFFLATVSVATRRRWREIAIQIAAMVTFTFAGWNINSVDAGPPETGFDATVWSSLLYGFGLIAILVGWGLYIGSRRELVFTLRERADRLEREQDLLTQQARDAERSQIAREMHDVLAHRISQISMQAGAIAFRTDLSADELRRAAEKLQANANAALIDLRGVLGVLRDPESGAALTAPQPRFSDIESLIKQARSDGMRITDDISVADGIDETLGRTLFRLTQECITNARKHAPDTVLNLRIVGSPVAGIDFTAANPLPIAGRVGPTVPKSGHGLVGLTERAELAGGVLHVNRSSSGFAVSCHLPWVASATITEYEAAQ